VLADGCVAISAGSRSSSTPKPTPDHRYLAGLRCPGRLGLFVRGNGVTASAVSGPGRKVGLAGAGLVVFAAILFFAFVYPQTPGRAAKPSAELIPQFPLWAWMEDGLPAPDSRQAVSLSIGLATVVIFVAYATALFAVWGRAFGRRTLLLLGAVPVLCLFISALAFPNVNSDIYSYIASGRVAAVHHANPYTHPPSDFPGDPLFPYVSDQYSGNVPSKLPAWMLLNVALAWLGGEDPVTILLVYRFALASLAVVCVTLIGLALREAAPRHTAAGVIAFGWNPILLVYGASKTDTMMVFLFILSAVLVVRSRRMIAAATLTLSALVKLITLPLLALYVLGEARLQMWRRVALVLLVAGSVVLLAYLPFTRSPTLLLDHLSLLTAVESAEGVNRSDESLAETLYRTALALGLIALLLWQVVRQDGSVKRLFLGWAILAIYFSVFLTTHALAWYQLLPLAAVALVPSGRLAVLIVASTFASFALGIWHSASSQAFPLGDLFNLPQAVVYLAPVAFAAMLVALLAIKTRWAR
jgi:uncharacterized membrane protein